MVVVGAGPAGLSAAIESRRAGARTLLLDEHDDAGGQYFRPRHSATTQRLGEFRPRGQELVRRARELGVDIVTSTSVWGQFDDKTLEAITWPTMERWRIHAKKIVIATGAHERYVPFQGWTLPGVVSTGFALHLATIDGQAVGKQVVVAGTGAFLPFVASELSRAGVKVLEVVEMAPLARLLLLSLPLLRLPSRGFEALRYLATLLMNRIPYQTSTVIAAAEGDDRIRRVHLTKVDGDGAPIAESERTLEIDALCVGFGFSPANDLARLFGCKGHYSDNQDGWIPERTERLESSIPGVYVVGEAAGIGGAHQAMVEGSIAGLSAAESANQVSRPHDNRLTSLIKKRHRLRRFSDALNSAFQLPDRVFDHVADDVVVCRCEGVTAGRIRNGVKVGTSDLNASKRFTRAAMGLCQGTMCTFPVTRLVARSGHASASELLSLTARNPLRPMPIESFLNGTTNTS